MHILILGGAGMVGRKLVERLVADGRLGERSIERITLFDVVQPHAPAGSPIAFRTVAGDLSVPGQAELLVASRPDVVFHLAAIVSGERRPISRRATGSIWTGREASSRRSASRGTTTLLASSSPLPSRCSGRRSGERDL
jgi:nucleoside-diphosphate-sugar epimerase